MSIVLMNFAYIEIPMSQVLSTRGVVDEQVDRAGFWILHISEIPMSKVLSPRGEMRIY